MTLQKVRAYLATIDKLPVQYSGSELSIGDKLCYLVNCSSSIDHFNGLKDIDFDIRDLTAEERDKLSPKFNRYLAEESRAEAASNKLSLQQNEFGFKAAEAYLKSNTISSADALRVIKLAKLSKDWDRRYTILLINNIAKPSIKLIKHAEEMNCLQEIGVKYMAPYRMTTEYLPYLSVVKEVGYRESSQLRYGKFPSATKLTPDSIRMYIHCAVHPNITKDELEAIKHAFTNNAKQEEIDLVVSELQKAQVAITEQIKILQGK